MSEDDDRREGEGAARQVPVAGEDGLIRIKLREVLGETEWAVFKANADKEGRTVEEHFKAITFQQRQGGGQGQAA